MVDELKNIIEEYLNWLYPNPVEVLDIKDFRDYFEVKVKSEPEILSDWFTTVIYCRDILDHTITIIQIGPIKPITYVRSLGTLSRKSKGWAYRDSPLKYLGDRKRI